MTTANVILWGTRIGAVAWDEARDLAFFEYDPRFLGSGIPLAPLTMPLAPEIYSFPELPRGTFHGLPGLLADSIPDRFGNALIDAWLETQGRSPGSLNAVERLCYTGRRGMGALEYHPSRWPSGKQVKEIEVGVLVDLANEILSKREKLDVSFDDDAKAEALLDILRVGTSAGGARAKAVVAWNPQTNEVRSGQLDAADGFSHWIIKFDGIDEEQGHELANPQGYGLIEHAYHRMALAAGIEMTECRIFEEGERRHFITRRSDRPDGKKLHMQSLGAMAHLDFNQPGAHSYEQALQVMQRLGLPMAAKEQFFRRMVFNVIARNQDDHVKNIAFLMDRKGRWSLAPAFDVMYSFNPRGGQTARHQMSLNGKRDEFQMADFIACGEVASLRRGRAGEIVDQVRDAVGMWRPIAEDVGVPAQLVAKIERVLRRQIDPDGRLRSDYDRSG